MCARGLRKPGRGPGVGWELRVGLARGEAAAGRHSGRESQGLSAFLYILGHNEQK